MAIDVAAYAVMSNHLHVVVWTDPERVEDWSSEEVARRWLKCGRGAKWTAKRLRFETAELVEDTARIALLRKRLSSLSWFMKMLKEPIAKFANVEDGVKGHFWEARFKSYRLLDEEAVLTCCAYVDLNPVRAGTAGVPEESTFVSLRTRLERYFTNSKSAEQKKRSKKHKKKGGQRGRRSRRRRAQLGSPWLIPLDAPSAHHASESKDDGAPKRSLFGIGFKGYLQLLDRMSRQLRPGSADSTLENAAPILKRIGVDAEAFVERLGIASAKAIDAWWGTAVGEKAALALEAARRGTRNAVDPIRRDQT